jgi:hypothetical protein
VPEVIQSGGENHSQGLAQWYEDRPAKHGLGLELDVKVPADKHKGATAFFYGLWCGNSTVRVGTNGLPVVPAHVIKEAVTELGSVVSGFEITGLGFAGLEGVLAIKDVGIAVRDERSAARKMSATQEAHGRAIQNLCWYRRTQDLKRRERLDRQLLKQAVNERASQAVVANREPEGELEGEPDGAEYPVNLHSDEIAPDPPPHGDELASLEDASAELADAIAAQQDAAAQPSADPAETMPGFSRPDCDGYLAYVDASHKHSKASADLWPKIIACIRDFGVQGARVVIDVLKKTGEIVFPQLLGHLFPWVFSIGMGIFHSVAAVFEWRQANRDRAQAEQVLEQTNGNRTNIERDAKRLRRLTKPLTSKVLAHFQENIGKAREHAARQRRWAIFRFIYGSFSTASGAAAIVAGAVFGIGAMIGSGGMILGVVAIAAGVAWLAFALYKIVMRMRMEKAQRVEQEQVRAALGAAAVKGNVKANTLEQCDLDDFGALVSQFGNLQDNPYLEAAKLAKLLLMESEGKRYSTKQERLDVSTTLQVLGMTKAMTSMLKRASFEKAHETIYSYLRGDAAQQAMGSGAFNRITENSESNI